MNKPRGLVSHVRYSGFVEGERGRRFIFISPVACEEKSDSQDVVTDTQVALGGYLTSVNVASSKMLKVFLNGLG